LQDRPGPVTTPQRTGIGDCRTAPDRALCAVAESSSDDSFDTWFVSIVQESAERRAEVMPWFRRLYDTHGAMTAGEVETAWGLDVLNAAERAVALTLNDVHRTTPWRPAIHLSDLYGNGLAITVEGHTRGATTADPTDDQAIVCEIADHIQEDLCERYALWPVCARHDAGLHAEVHDGAAVWWCRLGNHAVAAVGALGA
jgi:hypothetical protein